MHAQAEDKLADAKLKAYGRLAAHVYVDSSALAHWSRCDEESRRIIREELDTNILVEAGAGSGKTQMLAERMAAGDRVRRLPGRAHGRRDVHAQGGVGAARPFPPGAGELSSGSSQASELQPDATRDAARVDAALGNLERFFAGTIHSFCARLLRERPVESGVSPGFTELDEVQDQELRNRAWRDFIASARSAGDPRHADAARDRRPPEGSRLRLRDHLRERGRRVSAGRGVVSGSEAGVEGAREVLEGAGEALPGDHRRRHDLHDPEGRACSSGRSCASRGIELDRPAVIADLLETWDCESKIIQKSVGRHDRREEAVQGPDQAAARRLPRGRPSTPYLSQWRQYVYRLSVTLLTRAREHAASERRRLNSLNYGDLLNLTARVLRENRRSAARCSRSTGTCSSTSSRTPIRSRPRSCSLLAADESNCRVRRQPDRDRTGARVPLRPGALFVVGDPEAVDLSLPPRRHRDLQHRPRALQRPGGRPRAAADDELPVGAGAVRLGERGVRDAVPGRADAALAAVRAARSEADDAGEQSRQAVSSR